MLGRVHRGTPWQTIYLKSFAVSALTWRDWTGYASQDATATQPVNDWRLVSLLISLLNTNSPHNLLSVNERATEPWLTALDGIEVITNLSAVTSQTLTMASNSPQATLIAESIRATRAILPSQAFRTLGDILTVPELSVASPWLNTNSTIIVTRGISDEAYEMIPSQLLPRLRLDSLGTITLTNGFVRLDFTGFDGYAYAAQSSPNLTNWSTFSTNWPTNGVFSTSPLHATDVPAKYYRSALLP